MEARTHKDLKFNLSERTKKVIIYFIAYIFVALFIYTATDKLWDINKFIKFIGTLDLLMGFAKFVAWAIPLTEILISILLIFPLTRIKGLTASGILMVMFTGYLIYMKFTALVPCHCGGVISTLSWTEHIWFNVAFTFLAGIGIMLSYRLKSYPE